MKTVVLQLSGKDHIWGLDTSPTHTVKELDSFLIKIPISIGNDIRFYLEDYQVSLVSSDGYLCSESTNIFRESFGVSVGRLIVDNQTFEVFFDILALKLTAKRIESMLSFLYENNKRILSIIFSRTSLPNAIGNLGNADPEILVKHAEVFVEKFTDFRSDLIFNLKKRLLPQNIPVWMSKGDIGFSDIDDFFENIDRLSPAASDGDVLVNGRMFSVDKIYTTDLVESSAVYENSVILGGAFSILSKIKDVLLFLRLNFTRGHSSYDKEYESIGNCVARVTYGALEARCLTLVEKLEEIIRFLKDDLDIPYRGEIRPRVTPYVRGVKVYRMLFDQLAYWYDLGSPDFKGLIFLSKIRAVSKIYEFFCLYKICFFLHQKDWRVISASRSDELGSDIPKIVIFQKMDQTISLSYEAKITPIDKDVAHFSLVDLDHKLGWSRGFYSPDYILEHKILDEVYYFIMDAKYSSNRWVMKKDETGHLNQVFKKYYEGLGVVDLKRNVISNDRILAVSVLYPDDGGEYSGYEASRKYQGLQRLPIKSAVSLRDEHDKTFEIFLEKLIDLSTNLMK